MTRISARKPEMRKMWLAGWLLLSTWVVDAQESVTHALHFAESPAQEFLGHAFRREIAELPQPSVFARKGDRLVDLSDSECFKLARERKGWMVWNDTQKQLILHGPPVLLAWIEKDPLFERRKKVKNTFAWYRNVPFGAVVPENAVPEHRLDLFSLSGKSMGGAWRASAGERLQEINVNATSVQRLDPFPHFSGTYSFQWTEKNEEETRTWSLNASSKCLDGEVKILAQVAPPFGDTWTITHQSVALLQDDTPFEKSAWKEVKGKAVEMKQTSPPITLLSKARELKMQGSSYWLLEHDALGFDSMLTEKGDSSTDEDPAADANPPKRTRWKDAQEAVIPTELKEFVPHALIDIRTWARQHGIPLEKDEFLGYDPVNEKILSAVKEPVTADLLTALFSGLPGNASETIEMELKILRQEGSEPLSTHGVKITSYEGEKVELSCVNQQGSRKMKASFAPSLRMGNEIELEVGLEWPTLEVYTLARPLDRDTLLQSQTSGNVTTKVLLKAKAVSSLPR